MSIRTVISTADRSTWGLWPALTSSIYRTGLFGKRQIFLCNIILCNKRRSSRRRFLQNQAVFRRRSFL